MNVAFGQEHFSRLFAIHTKIICWPSQREREEREEREERRERGKSLRYFLIFAVTIKLVEHTKILSKYKRLKMVFTAENDFASNLACDITMMTTTIDSDVDD